MPGLGCCRSAGLDCGGEALDPAGQGVLAGTGVALHALRPIAIQKHRLQGLPMAEKGLIDRGVVMALERPAAAGRSRGAHEA